MTDLELLRLKELQRAAIERANAEITQDEFDGYAIRYAAAVRERREQHQNMLDRAAVTFDQRLRGE
jgi:hypothetical protein